VDVATYIKVIGLELRLEKKNWKRSASGLYYMILGRCF